MNEAGARQIAASEPGRSSWVAANAGSGKTRVLTDRVARLLLAGTEPARILCLTYTKAAAAEMQTRLFRTLGAWAMLDEAELRAALATLGEAAADLDAARLAQARTLFARALETPGGLKIQTIHAFCEALLRRFPLEAGVAPGFVVLASPSRPFVGMESGIFAFLPPEQRFERVVRLDRPGQRFNDATVDDTGRLWASTMATDASPGLGVLHVVMPDLTLRTMLDGLTTPNGLAADVRRGRLFVSDSHPDAQTIWTTACDFSTGDLGVREVFASMTELAGRPDGAALGQGAEPYWIAGVDGGALYGYSSGGQLDWIVPLPFPAPTKAAFFTGGMAVTAKAQGGHDGRLAIAGNVPPVLRGPGVAFWKPGGL